MAEPLRLGRVGFLNTYPVEWGLSRHLRTGAAEEVTGVPTALNRMLAAGEMDVANVSSVEYARNSAEYVLLPSLCVGSDGAVASVQLVTEVPLERIRTVAATSQSASSVALVRTLLPSVEILGEDETGDARLLIGDEALHSAFHDPTPHIDLGELWRDRTGLPMVFAVWAARREVAEERLLEIDARSPPPSPTRTRTPPTSPATRACATPTPPATSRATSSGCATASAPASGRGSAASSRWPTRTACSTRSRSCASPARR